MHQQHAALTAEQTAKLRAELEAIGESVRAQEASIQGYDGMLSARRVQLASLEEDMKGLRGGPLEWTKDNHFRTKQYYRLWKWDTAKNAVVRVQDWQAIAVKQ